MATRHTVAGSASWVSKCIPSSSRGTTSSRPFSSSSSRSVVRRNQRTYGNEEVESDSFGPSADDPSSNRNDVSYDRSSTSSSETPQERQKKLMDKYYAHSYPGWKPTYDYAVLPDPPPLPKTHGIHVATLRLTANELKNLEFYSQWCYLSARSFGMPARRPERLPRSKELITVLKGPFVHKKFQENFEKLTFKRDIKVYDTSRETLDLWLRYIARNAMGGLAMKVKVHEWVDYGWGKKDIEAVEAQFEGLSVDNESAIRRRAYELVKQMAGQEEADRMLKAIPQKPEPEVKDHIRSDMVQGSSRRYRSVKTIAVESMVEEATPRAVDTSTETLSNSASSNPAVVNTMDGAVEDTSTPQPHTSPSTPANTDTDPVSELGLDTATPPTGSTASSSEPTPADHVATPAPTVVTTEENVVEVAPILEASEPTSELGSTPAQSTSSSSEVAHTSTTGSTETAGAPSPQSDSTDDNPSVAASAVTDAPVSADVKTTASPNLSALPTNTTSTTDSVTDGSTLVSPAPTEETVEERSKAETESAISDAIPEEPEKVVKSRAKRTTKAATSVEPNSTSEAGDNAESMPKKRATRKKAADAATSEAEPVVSSSQTTTSEETAADQELPKKRAPRETKDEVASAGPDVSTPEAASEPAAAPKKTRAKKVVPEVVDATSSEAPAASKKTRAKKVAPEGTEVSDTTNAISSDVPAAEVKTPKKRVTKKDKEAAEAATKEDSGDATEEVKAPKKRVTKKKADEAKEGE